LTFGQCFAVCYLRQAWHRNSSLQCNKREAVRVTGILITFNRWKFLKPEIRSRERFVH
jgi:hypothetical protein